MAVPTHNTRNRFTKYLLTPVLITFGALAFLPVSVFAAKCDSLIHDLQ